MEIGKDKVTPKITIDRFAIRFELQGESHNMFFCDLFRGTSLGSRWQDDVMNLIKVCYDECIKYNIEPPKEEEDDQTR